MVFNTTFNNISFISLRCGQFYWWRKSEYPAKATFTMSGMQKTYLFQNWFHFAIILCHLCCLLYWYFIWFLLFDLLFHAFDYCL